MGLAPFGDPRCTTGQVGDIVRVDADGTIRIDLSYFSYQFWGYQRCSDRSFTKRSGAAPSRRSRSRTTTTMSLRHFSKGWRNRALKLCRVLRRRTQARHLVIAGGVALNSVMNGRILREAGFDDIYVMPAAGDNGTSIGAALLRLSHIAQAPARGGSRRSLSRHRLHR